MAESPLTVGCEPRARGRVSSLRREEAVHLREVAAKFETHELVDAALGSVRDEVEVVARLDAGALRARGKVSLRCPKRASSRESGWTHELVGADDAGVVLRRGKEGSQHTQRAGRARAAGPRTRYLVQAPQAPSLMVVLSALPWMM